MSITIEQSDAAILATFHSMEESFDYVLNDFWFAEMNRIREKYIFSIIENKEEYIFSRKGEKLFVNGDEAFDFNDKTNITLSFTFTITYSSICTSIALALSLALALQHNGIEKLNTGCEGKVVEIDGRKYKLTAV